MMWKEEKEEEDGGGQRRRRRVTKKTQGRLEACYKQESQHGKEESRVDSWDTTRVRVIAEGETSS